VLVLLSDFNHKLCIVYVIIYAQYREGSGPCGVYPSLDFLDDNGDLVYTDDFRTLYNTIAQKWLSTESKRVSEYGLYDFI
jgi:hypothetical protein